jgi:2-keto-4-pentenoate hydratase/2-oxohepta-3-ene-1,7-dioic acid hydratase in catechol pathway
MDKIICLGKNYLEHAKELGDAVPEKPVIFFKPPSAIADAKTNGAKISLSIPKGFGSLHFETEVVLKLKIGGRFKDEKSALAAIDSVTLGLDMTLRDLQTDLKKQGHPWEIAKAFSHSAIIGPFIPYANAKNLLEKEFTFSIGGKIRQTGRLSQMRFSITEALVYISKYFELCAGDLIFTGTPAGVGPVTSGEIGTLRWGDEIEYHVHWE